MEQQRATLADIAQAAGVSIPTVSKVLNGRPDVAAATRHRVQTLLDARGYTARGTGRPAARAGLIDLVLRDLGSPWAMQIIDGVEELAYQVGFGVVVSAVHGRHRTRPDRRWTEQLAARRCDGVLLVLSDISPAQRGQLEELGIPVVIIDPAGQPPADIPSVGATNWAGGRAATEHLLDLGHRRIAAIGGPPTVPCSRARVDGYRAAMDAAGQRIPAGHVRTGDFLAPSGYRETHALLDLARPPTAIFACSDEMALGAYEALYERGLRAPDDMSVVGFDDLDAARWAVPPLTTVRQPLTEMAAMATRMLLSLVNGEELASDRIELATSLVVRQSTRPC
ncbi:LacI family transcriptional regulator [Micromonospora sp. ATCC 39149]|uniref:LacI family DNA-binding transcriptional regulator n=1 Tax=Micromonospora carbonacea TaxID=47853 RepID=A0A7D6CCX7_9ACTN|nr:LacI family DNA-binding transcriptional regulator [Micromonospora sp. ATCC 39149]EEP70151.1 LacI family transcriptional regulator [Micromonospora sp. ATCC 39149]QLJ96589.1 LacI family DNA-binding transcriptional regulator [Micromonospora carbonacea]